jgi:serine/threonine protein kinase
MGGVIGRRLGRFEIVEELGSGGMGTVYRAHDPTLQRDVALKVLPGGTLDVERRRRFLGEARAASALSHPSIVTVYELGSEGDLDFIAMELVEGRSLSEVLAGGRLEPDRVRDYATDLAQALHAAHEAGVIHRDLKPDNVMVAPDGGLKILDFGVAKRRSTFQAPSGRAGDETVTGPPQTLSGVVLGTPAYMAPEQARGGEVDARTDLFSLGCVIYELLTGQRPFRGDRSVEVLSAILRDEPPPPSALRPELSPVWDRLVGRLLAKDPESRYPSAIALLADLKALAESAAQPSSAGGRGTWLAAAAAIVVVGAIGAATLWLPALREAEPQTPAESSDGFPEYRFRLAAQLPGSPESPTLSADGQMVAFAMEDDAGVDQIWVMDLAGGEPRQITSGDVPAGAPDWSPRGDRILFHRRQDGIWEVPPLGGDAHQLVPEGAHPVASRDGDRIAYNRGRRLWLAAGDGSAAQPHPSFEPTFFGYFARPAFSPDGTRVVTFWPRRNTPLGDLWIAPVEGGEPRQLTDLGFLSWGAAPVWSADGRWIVFTSDHGGSINLWRIPAAGGHPEPVTVGAGSDLAPDLSSDMGRLVYANGRNAARIHLHDPATGHTRLVLERRSLAIVPRLSPEGTRVAFFDRADGGFHLFVADLETGEARQVTRGRGVVDTHPRWSADGETLSYDQQPQPREPAFTFRRISVDGRGDEKLIEGWRWPVNHQAQPSPDETRIVYLVREAGQNLEARVRDLSSGDEHVLPQPLYDPMWTADGSQIYGATWRPYQVHVCRADGSACHVVTEGWSARPSRDGSTIHVLRGGPPQVWRHDRASGDEEKLITVEPYDAFNFGWGVTPTGKVMFHTQHEGRLELWLGEAVPALGSGRFSATRTSEGTPQDTILAW